MVDDKGTGGTRRRFDATSLGSPGFNNRRLIELIRVRELGESWRRIIQINMAYAEYTVASVQMGMVA